MREGHLREAAAQGVRFFEPVGERFGPVEGEDAARARMRVAFVAEESLDAGGFVEEREARRLNRREEVWKILAVAAGLIGDTRKRGACFLGLDDADRLAVDEQQVVAAAALQRHFAQRDAAPGGEVERLVILNDPAAVSE